MGNKSGTSATSFEETRKVLMRKTGKKYFILFTLK